MGTSNLVTHYIGVYDPRKQSLKLVPAKKMTVRSTLKTSRPKDPPDSDNETKPAPTMSSRAALALAFGTKKSQKAVKESISNAIASQKGTQELDAVAEAVLSSMPTETVSKESVQAGLDAQRPIPPPNLEAPTPADVYPLSVLIGNEETLSKIRVKEWLDAKEANEAIDTKSHFTKTRIWRILEKGDVKQTRILRYTELLIAWYRAIFLDRDNKRKRPTWEHSRASSKPVFVPKSDSAPIASILSSTTSLDVLNGLTRHFTPDGNGEFDRWHEERLITHIFGLALYTDNYEVDMYDLRWDLQLTPPEAAKLFQEMGCQVTVLRKGEYEKMGLARLEARERKVARLKVPVKLPKPRGGGKAKKR